MKAALAPGFIGRHFYSSLVRTGDDIEYLRGRRFLLDSDALAGLTGSARYNFARIEQEPGFGSESHLREGLADMIRFLGVQGR